MGLIGEFFPNRGEKSRDEKVERKLQRVFNNLFFIHKQEDKH